MSDRPWMTALEMQLAAWRLVRHVEARPNAEPVFHARALRTALAHAECFTWTCDTVTAVAMAAHTIPRTVALAFVDLPARYGWWWFEAPIRVGPDVVHALVWGPDEEPAWWRVWMMSRRPDVVNHDIPIPLLSFRMREGVSIEDMDASRAAAETEKARQEGLATIQHYRFILAALQWLKQRIVGVVSGHIERHRRKQLAREHNLPLPSDVKVIELRRYESEPHGANPHPEPVDWSCRWIVNGHWRKQPTKDGIKVIPIGPYVKGPADKPLKVPAHTVYRVDR